MVGPEGTKRISKIDTYLNVAEAFAYRSTCIKRKYGAVIVKDDVVISTGYNGSPRGYDNCCDIGECPRIKLGMHQGEGYGLCRAIHAEQNALLNCSREQTIGADLYLAGINPGDNSVHRAKPCPICSRLIIQAGIKNVYLRVGAKAGEYEVVPAKDLVWHLYNKNDVLVQCLQITTQYTCLRIRLHRSKSLSVAHYDCVFKPAHSNPYPACMV